MAVATVRSEMTWLQLFLSFQGRIARSTFWLQYMLPLLGLFIGATIVDASLGTVETANEVGLLSGLLSLVSFYPTLAVFVKRCHDRGRSAWFLLLWLLPLLNIWVLIELGCLKGTTGPNAYGEDPLS